MTTANNFPSQGGYATVYEVFDADKNIYAIKVVDLSEQRASMKQDLIREILFLEKLKHSNLIVKALDYEIIETEKENKVLILMEKGDRNLYDILTEHKQKQSLSPAKLRFKPSFISC